MERLTRRIGDRCAVKEGYKLDTIKGAKCIVDRLAAIEDILGDVYDLDCLSAMIDIIRSARLGEPLTIEQMRHMDGLPVFVEWKDGRIPPRWYIVGDSAWNMMEFDGFDGYGDWFAYEYPPSACIDWSKWEPCELCECRTLDSFGIKDSEIILSHSFYTTVNDRFQFCPKCGRPLTEEARGDLEKRLRMRESMTNGDRICAMRDEELYDAIKGTDRCPPEKAPLGCDRNCAECWIDWLGQPAEDGGNEGRP